MGGSLGGNAGPIILFINQIQNMVVALNATTKPQ